MAFKIAEAYVEVTADDSQALTKVEALQRELDIISDKRINLEITDAEAAAKIDEIKLKLDELTHDRDINVRIHAEEALGEAEQVRGELRNIEDDEKHLDDTSKRTGASMGGMFSNLAPFILPAIQSIGQLSGAFGLLPAVAIAADTAFGVAKIGLDAFKEPLDKLPPSARATVEAVKGLGPAWDSAKTDVQSKLFANLSDVVKKVGSSDLPVLRTGLDQMATAFNSGAKDVGAWLTSTKTIGDLKTIFTNNGVAAQDFMRALQPILGLLRDVATVASQFLPQLATHFANAAQKAADFVSHARETGQLASWIQTGITAVGKLWDVFKNLFEIIVKITNAPPLFGLSFLSILDTVSGLILKLVTAFPQLIPIIEALVIAWKAWTIAVIAWDAAMAANPVVLVIAALVALGIALFEVIKHWDQVKAAFAAGWEQIKTAFSAGMNAVKTAFTTGWDQIKSVAQSAMDSVKNTAQTGWDQIKSAATSAWDGIKNTVTTGWDQIKSATSSAISAVESTASSGWSQIQSAASSAWSAISSAISSAWSTIQSTISSAISTITSTLTSAWNTVKSTATAAWQGIVSAVQSSVNTMLGVIRAIPGQITSALGNLSGLLVQAGKNVIQGLINGIQSMAGAVASAISNIASTIRGALPFSPAKWGPLSGHGAPDIAGGMISRMLAEGMIGNLSYVRNAAQRLAGETMWDNDYRQWSVPPISSLPNEVDYGTVSRSTWRALLNAGWLPDISNGKAALIRPQAATPTPPPNATGTTGTQGGQTVIVNITQTSGSSAETGRLVALALRTVS